MGGPLCRTAGAGRHGGDRGQPRTPRRDRGIRAATVRGTDHGRHRRRVGAGRGPLGRADDDQRVDRPQVSGRIAGVLPRPDEGRHRTPGAPKEFPDKEFPDHVPDPVIDVHETGSSRAPASHDVFVEQAEPFELRAHVPSSWSHGPGRVCVGVAPRVGGLRPRR
ncbi:hypothetical protein GPN2_14216 [Streptomyces murinus]